MFDIRFVESTSNLGSLARGRIQTGEFTETFEAAVEYWVAARYEAHWTEAASRLVAGQTPSAFITSLTDPQSANFLVWWPAYLDGSMVHIQNSLLFLDRLNTPFDEGTPYVHVEPRETLSEDGSRISEWSVSLESIRCWLEKVYV